MKFRVCDPVGNIHDMPGTIWDRLGEHGKALNDIHRRVFKIQRMYSIATAFASAEFAPPLRVEFVPVSYRNLLTRRAS